MKRLLEQTSLKSPKFSGFWLNLEQAKLERIEFGLDTDKGPLIADLQGVKADYVLESAALKTIAIDRANLKFSYRPDDPSVDSGSTRLYPPKQLNVERLDLQVDTPWGESYFTGQVQIHRSETGKLEAIFREGRHRLDLKSDSDFGDVEATLQHPSGQTVAELRVHRLDHGKRLVLEANVSPLAEWLTTSAWLPNTLRAKMAASTSPSFAETTASTRLKLTADVDDFDRIESELQVTQNRDYLGEAEIRMAQDKVDIDAHLDMAAAVAWEFIKPWLPTTAKDWRITKGRMSGTLRMSGNQDQIVEGRLRLKAYDVDFAAGPISLEKA